MVQGLNFKHLNGYKWNSMRIYDISEIISYTVYIWYIPLFVTPKLSTKSCKKGCFKKWYRRCDLCQSCQMTISYDMLHILWFSEFNLTMNLDQKPFGRHLFLRIFWWSFLHLIFAWKPTGINSLQGFRNIDPQNAKNGFVQTVLLKILSKIISNNLFENHP